MQQIKSLLINLPRKTKKQILISHDVVMICLAFFFSLLMRLDGEDIFYNFNIYIILLGILPLTILVNAYLETYRTILRFSGSKFFRVSLISSSISSLLFIAIAFLLHIPLPRSVPVMYFLVLMLLLVFSREMISYWLRSNFKQKDKHHVLIYGAGDSGRQLLEAIKQVGDYLPIGFIDDNLNLSGMYIRDLPVYRPDQTAEVIKKYGIEKILLACPSATSKQKKKIIHFLEPFACEVLTIPGMKDLVDGKVTVSSLKKITIEDLLGREPVKPVLSLMQANISNKCVMVTGAGGSIGSELCRQIIVHNPERLILFESSEYSLYQIHKEISENYLDFINHVDVIPLLGSVQNQVRLEFIMQSFAVQTVYHAAAYKHVPMVEYNVIEGIRNNVFGTLHCALASIKAKVETFVLISTDKAVRPTNIMGASKRMAELALQALSHRKDIVTKFCMVRFGNVLGSSGSVVPVFEKQIAKGGPLTITDPEITRFFMTIPEAAQLVIQAGAMGVGGDVFVLEMGEAVKIIDLARRMIHLSGLQIRNDNNPDGDIDIIYTGLRPGEKLYEELLIGENVTETSHPRILTANEIYLSWDECEPLFQKLDQACREKKYELIQEMLLQAPLGYTPKDGLSDLTWLATKKEKH